MTDLTLRVLFQDTHLIVLDKPPGLPVHGGPSGKASLEDYFPQLATARGGVPVAAHRLDQDTSGCLILARHDKARSRLGRLFEAGAITKTYWAIVAGGPVAEAGLIDRPIAKISSAAAGWRMVPDPAGRPAVTGWQVLGRGIDAAGRSIACLALMPQTGRTHQLRVHLAAAGWPILGDPVYGDGVKGAGPCLMLHARSLVVPYRTDGPALIATAPPPAAFRAVLDGLTPRFYTGDPN